MIVVTRERGTREWREAHRDRITASDAAAILAGEATARRRALVDRLVLDLEGHGLHTDEFPEPWQERHEEDLRAALACYRRRTGRSVIETGLVAFDALPWLAVSPHGLLGHSGCLVVRCRQTLRAYREGAGVSRADLCRAQLTMVCCDRTWCELADFLDGRGQVEDRLRVRRIDLDEGWLCANVFPRLLGIWECVRTARAARKGLESRP